MHNRTMESQLVPYETDLVNVKDNEKGHSAGEKQAKGGKNLDSLVTSSMASTQSAEAENEAALRQRTGW